MAVEHLPADVDGICEETDATTTVTMDRRWVPMTSSGSRNPVGIEAFGDCHTRTSGRELPEDATDDCGFLLNDAPVAADKLAVGPKFTHDFVAIGNAAGREAGTRLSDLSAERLRGQITGRSRGTDRRCRSTGFSDD